MKTWSSEREWEVTIQPPTWWLAGCATSRGPDYQGWCTGQIYDCCLKHMTTGKNLCESLSLVWMSTVQEIQDGQKIISNSSASISRSRIARKNTMIFDIHQLSCSFLVTRKNVFVFFLVSGSETSLLTNFSFKVHLMLCLLLHLTFPWLSRFFFSASQSICKNIWLVHFPFQTEQWALPGVRVLVLNEPPCGTDTSHQLSGCRTSAEAPTWKLYFQQRAGNKGSNISIIFFLQAAVFLLLPAKF